MEQNDIKYFIERFDQFCFNNGKDEDYKVNNLPMHLTGRAQKLYSKLSDEIKEDYDLLTEHLKNYFSVVQLPPLAAYKKTDNTQEKV